MTVADLIAEINTRIEFINGQVVLGAKREDLCAEQHKALLATFANKKGLSIADVTKVSQHLADSGEWDTRQQEAFSACLRAACARSQRLNQPNWGMATTTRLRAFSHRLGKPSGKIS